MVKQPILDVSIFRRDVDSGNISTEPEQLTDVTECDVRLGVETIKDVFSIKTNNNIFNPDTFTWTNPLLKNINALNSFQIGDYIRISAYYNQQDLNPDNNVLIFGEITDYSYNNAESTPSITLNGTNITENLLQGFALTTTKVDDVINTVPGIIKTIISRLNRSSLPIAKRIFAALDNEYHSYGGISNITGSYGGIASTKSTGETFKEITYTKTWQPVYRIIEDLSSTEYTGDEQAGNYIFYVKVTPVLPEHVGTLQTNYINELVFKPVSNDVVKTLVRGVDYNIGKITKNNDEVTNVLIVKPGTEPDGDGITTFVTNNTSIGKIGPKYGFWSKPEIGTVAKEREKDLGEQIGSTFIGFTPGSLNDVSGSQQFPWTFQSVFNREDTYPFTEDKNTPLTADDSDEYSSILRTEILKRGKIEAQNIVNNLGESRYSANISLINGSNEIGMGTIIALQEKTSGWDSTTLNPDYKLRIRDIRHKFSDSGWDTELVLKEDEKTISDKINT